ncbi:uncharacterized protein LOC143470543 isoform X2 [Clavelina lepadiformis]|uniref:uncharacterized protein LOC143470543 isoform X2 n=1 Tax=Clavelina lepadiformis TaxID=159417 RepID=UPI0040432711
MSAEVDDFTKKLLDRTKARREALQQKMQEHSFQARKRRPLEAQDNIIEENAPVCPVQVEANAEIAMTLVASESPSKRCKIDTLKPAVLSENNSSAEKHPAGEKNVSERMKKLLEQRKQWEAADHDDEVDFTCVSSPVSHDPDSPMPAPLNRKIDLDRKARFAALAEKVNNFEDDLTHSNVPSASPEKPKAQWKPPKGPGRKTPMSDAYQSDILADNELEDKEVKSDENVRPVKHVSQRVSLSIETLSQFASKDAKAASQVQQQTPVRNNVKNKYGDKITFESYKSDASGEGVRHQITPTTKSLHQRLIELQKNGCKAEQAAGVDKAIADRQQELNQLRQKHVKNEQQTADELVDEEEEECMAVTSSESIKENASLNESAINDESIINLEDSEASLDEESASSYGDDMLDSIDDEDADIQLKVSRSEDVNSSRSKNVSVHSVDDNDSVSSIQNNMHNLSVEGNESTAMDDTVEDAKPSPKAEDHLPKKSASNDEEEIFKKESESEEEQMIDELFEGVTDGDTDDSLLEPPLYSNTSLLDLPSLTRQKSRQEIRSELTVHKRTCHEAEDRHLIQQQPSRRLRPMARSNSMESVVSLDTEKKEQAEEFPVFTIDAYRTEKRKSIRKVEKKIVRKEKVKPSQPNPEIKSLQEMNSQLLEEVQQQQRVIQQASAALNCCYDAHHGKGSITELEAEKLLLIASEKRLALLAEIQKLKMPKSRDSSVSGMQPCRGSLTIDHIQLPLRTEYIFSMASKKDGGDAKGHYYFILVRCGAQKIFATHLASTQDSLSADSLVFRDKFQFSNLESDFDISIEVYSVNHRARADGVPTNEKSKSKFSGILQKSLTPRKKSKSSHMTYSHTASPGGPNAIRISSFSIIGSITLKLEDVDRKNFTLQKVPFLSPITGHLGCRISTNVQSIAEQSGFLTMFDDVGGLGAWHRRWCVLRHGVIYSWTYPDDEKHKDALSKLQMRECISLDVRTVERIMCARPNTFEVRTMRPRRQGDKDNLISQDTGSVIQTKHWLAADTKEERICWIDALNRALADVRAWDPTALKPLTQINKV